MKIFFSLNHFLPDRLAGIELYTFNLARSLQATGAEVAVLIPLFGGTADDHYHYEGIRVLRYAENSISSREMVLGKLVPEGLDAFIKILEKERPAILHFHELSAGRGVGMYHVQSAAALGIKILLTCHLSTYSCQTGRLVYKDERICDGLIRTHVCTACAYDARGLNGIKSSMLQSASKLMYSINMNASHWNTEIGTALGFPFLVDKKKNELLELAALCDKIVVLTRWYQKILEDNGVAAEKILYCPQGLTGNAGSYKKAVTQLPLKIAFVGRISHYKGVHLLLEALKEMPAGQMQLDIYGPVTEEDYAQQCFLQSAKMENVHWMGNIASEKVIPMLTGYDLLCLPSTFSEMSPLVIQEAFAAGVPVLASNVYGNAEQVKDGVNGWLFEFKSVASLKEKLGKLVENPGLIEEAKKNIPATRGFDVVAEEHLEMYREALRG